MATSKERMQRRALRGTRVEIDELLIKTRELIDDFPELSTLDAAESAICAVVEEFDERLGDGTKKDDDDNASRPNGRPKHSKRPEPVKAKPRAKTKATKISDVGPRISWESGRPVLLELAKAPDGLDSDAIAKALGITRAAAYARLKVREAKGHVKILDHATGIFGITTDGRAKLAKDQDK